VIAAAKTMPSRIGRLLERKDFLRVAAARRKWVAPGLIVQAAANPVPEAAGRLAQGRRVGLTASKKVGNAVARNRAKRRLRALVRDLMVEGAAPDQDYVIIARAETVKRPFALLKDDFDTALRRLAKRRFVDSQT
jgi:ribonuclease P protein component